MGRLVDADICLHKAWQNFYKQEEEHEKNIDGYDIMRDQFYEQSGFECCQQTIVNAPTVAAIHKAEYKARLKADMVAMLKELDGDIERLQLMCDKDDLNNMYQYTAFGMVRDKIIEKINELKGGNNEKD